MSDTPLSAYATTLDEARGVIDRLERELATKEEQLNAAKHFIDKYISQRDLWRTRCKEAQRCLGELIESSGRHTASRENARDAGKDE